MKIIFILTLTIVMIFEIECRGGYGGHSGGHGYGGGHSGGHGYAGGHGSFGHSSGGRSRGWFGSSSRGSYGRSRGSHGSSSRGHVASFGTRRGGTGFWNSFTSVPFFSRFTHKISSKPKSHNNNEASKPISDGSKSLGSSIDTESSGSNRRTIVNHHSTQTHRHGGVGGSSTNAPEVITLMSPEYYRPLDLSKINLNPIKTPTEAPYMRYNPELQKVMDQLDKISKADATRANYGQKK